MRSKKDIEDREDIRLLVDSFYRKVLADKTIGYIFTEIAKINFEEHMPKMYDFWESTVLSANVYKGNPMQVHITLNDKEKLTKIHFDRWLQLFNETTDELFQGEKAETAKTRALSIATVIQIKIQQTGGQQ